MRGKTGIGKSQLVRQLAKTWGFDDDEIIDRRLAQMSEGDMVGLPSTDGNVTRFNPPDWYKRACDFPVVLFLDELNRATNEVMQAAFQIVLDRELNGFKLHPGTRVLSAVNIGGEYVVNEMDPALLRRFWTVDLDPTTKDWTKWARETKIADVIIDFIETDDTWLHAAEKGNMEDVQPNPASWERLSNCLNVDDLVYRPNDSIFRSMCLGFIGTEATAKFVEYAKSVNAHLTSDIIANEYEKVRKNALKTLSKERWASAVENLGTWCRNLGSTTPTVAQLENIKLFMSDAPIELRIGFMSKMSTAGKGEDSISPETLANVGVIWAAIKDVCLESYLGTTLVEEKKKPGPKTSAKKPSRGTGTKAKAKKKPAAKKAVTKKP